jgi:hypothetical protein
LGAASSISDEFEDGDMAAADETDRRFRFVEPIVWMGGNCLQIDRDRMSRTSIEID